MPQVWLDLPECSGLSKLKLMLDLDHLAAQCAARLNQKAESWRSVVWSPAFQKMSASMSDGEVEALMSWCESSEQLRAVVEYMEKRMAENPSTSPFALVMEESKKAGMEPGPWIQSQVCKGKSA